VQINAAMDYADHVYAINSAPTRNGNDNDNDGGGFYARSDQTASPVASTSNWTLDEANGGDSDGCVTPCPFYVVQTAMSTPIYGFLSPPVILFTVITNSLICAVLLRRNMRTATNALLLAMALSDMMTGLWPLPCYVYFHTFGAHREYVPYRWCVVYSALTEHLPTVFHTASIWLTVALALHRYVCVCRPQVIDGSPCVVSSTMQSVDELLWMVVAVLCVVEMPIVH
jgi:7 transmembrane receptor (rhodopsin family)